MSLTNGVRNESISSSTLFVTRASVAERFRGKSVAIVGSAPTILRNKPGFIDSHDIVVRVNNYKLAGDVTGSRTDVFYSFFGTSIRKPAPALKADGVQLCMCKLPNSQPIDSEWHRERKKWAGIDYRYIYQNRAAWWFCDTYVPTDDEFLEKFNFLGQHQPTTGFAAILDILSFDCRSVYITGFDFFESRLHNVDEPWKEGAHDDPIRHRPDLERLHVLQFARINPEKITLDDALRETL